ncbi:hypothetical protein [Stratiformator vulcanicus]|uniref:Uncharacterized protein n=1 Tax=Stratiformator vulcanicus TaxID=2527980 RepID=A0A517R4E5_9PLAN|nr:hypothetical protein [Stratiformator vulcanicus]QDT38762.1 hypothetical protein Pan189_31600 [Stratiformator vulcanicus]
MSKFASFDTDLAPGKPDGVRAWVRERLRKDLITYLVVAAVLLPVAMVAAGITYAVIFAVSYFLLAVWLGFSIPLYVLHIIASVGLVALFWLNKRVEQAAWAPVRIRNEVVNTTVRVSQMTGAGWLLLLQSPRDMNPVLRGASNLFLFAPRLFDLFGAIIGRVWNMRTIDVASCGRAVTLLLNARGKVNLAELVNEFQQHDPQKLVDDLAAVDGVVFLVTDPPGVTLSPLVADEYKAWRDAKRGQTTSTTD